MGKLISLLKASMTEGMQIFQIGKNKNGKKANPAFPIIIAVFVAIAAWGYANMFLDSLAEVGAGFVVLTLFALIISLMTIVEGVYKSSSLLFNCKDDDLMLSLPVKKSTVLFIRLFKFYLFELLYNSLLLIPTMIAYAMRVEVGPTFFVASAAALIFLPVVPIVIGCIIGGITAGFSARFKMKNLVQIITTTVFLIAILVVLSKLESIMGAIAENATSINEVITKLYYPVGAYISMVTDFNIWTLILYIAIHLALFGTLVAVLGKVYYKINSRVKTVKNHAKNLVYKVKKKSVMNAIIAKEMHRFIDSPVFVVNAGFGLVLFVIGCYLVSFNVDSAAGLMNTYGVKFEFDLPEILKNNAPAILFGLIVMGSMMSSITCSMISLEGRSYNILKTIPVKPEKILLGKVLTAVIIMLPFILVGDLIMLLRFNFSALQILLILLASFVLPMVAELFGIIFNLKYPKMNAETDAEAVKQSVSALVATFFGMGVTAVVVYGLIQLLSNGVSLDLVLASGVGIFAIVFVILAFYIKKTGTKKFYSIEA
ncbi:hypothetical protein IJG79_03100 [Candidatus Saccharibacteria bacterium]|nr:hypothetical protein [Candidatus Saccharibacteria bacterium]